MNNSKLTTALVALLFLSGVSLAADDAITLPAGKELHVELVTTLSSKVNDPSDLWTGKVLVPVFGEGKEIVPEGSIVEGHVTYVKRTGHGAGKGEMRLVIDSLRTPDTLKYSIVATLQDAQGAKVKDQEGTVQGGGKDGKGTAVDTGIGAAAGAGVGVMVHGGTGALYGMGIGAMAGLAHGVLKKGKDLVLPQGTEMVFVISRDTTLKQVPPKQ